MKKITFGENKNLIHKKLKLLRVERNMTQAQLAAKLQTYGINIDQQMISKIENNDRIVTDYEIVCICRIMNISIDEMVNDIEITL